MILVVAVKATLLLLLHVRGVDLEAESRQAAASSSSANVSPLPCWCARLKLRLQLGAEQSRHHSLIMFPSNADDSPANKLAKLSDGSAKVISGAHGEVV